MLCYCICLPLGKHEQPKSVTLLNMKIDLLNFKAKLQLTLWIYKTLSQESDIQKFMSESGFIRHPISEKLVIYRAQDVSTSLPKSRIGIVEMSSSSRTRAVKTATICLTKKKQYIRIMSACKLPLVEDTSYWKLLFKGYYALSWTCIASIR